MTNDISKELAQEQRASKYQEIMNTQNLLKVIDEVKNDRYLVPFDISKLLRVRTITAPIPEWTRKKFENRK